MSRNGGTKQLRGEEPGWSGSFMVSSHAISRLNKHLQATFPDALSAHSGDVGPP